MLLADRRLLITGVLTDQSIAYAVAERAQQHGAEVVLTGFGRGLRLTQRMAKRLPREPEVLELDVDSPEQLQAVHDALDAKWGAVDGVLHAIAYVPPEGLGGRFLTTPPDLATQALRTSAVSLQALTSALLPLLERSPHGGSVVGLDFDGTRAWPGYDWAGVTKAALEAVNRYLAGYLGPKGVRCNLVAAGPIATMAAKAIDGFGDLSRIWEDGSPLKWDPKDATPVADACIFLLSDLSRAITGDVLHVDGGVHAMGAPAALAQLEAERETMSSGNA